MAAVSPTLRIRCPYCWKEFHPGDCAVYSTTNPKKLIYPAPNYGTPEYEHSRTWIADLKGPDLALELPVRHCPNPACRKPLFEGIEECRNINIAIVGDTGSGKTSYIAVLINELERGVLMQNGDGLVQLIPRNSDTDQTYQTKYYGPIIKDLDAQIAGTLPGAYDQQGMVLRTEPLIYLLRIKDNRAHTDTKINLLLFDISGEDFADDRRLVLWGEHALRADGIIYLADPISMEHIRQQIPQDALISTPTGRTPQKVLTTVAHRLASFNGKAAGAKISIPTAIAISKSDLLQYVIPEQERRNYWFFYGSLDVGKAHIEDIRHIHEDVRSILYRFGERGLLQMEHLFDQINFFAITATGSAPDQFTMKYTDIKPNRCLDPFIWLLWKYRFLQAVR